VIVELKISDNSSKLIYNKFTSYHIISLTHLILDIIQEQLLIILKNLQSLCEPSRGPQPQQISHTDLLQSILDIILPVKALSDQLEQRSGFAVILGGTAGRGGAGRLQVKLVREQEGVFQVGG
jgi:hypothetical protein